MQPTYTCPDCGQEHTEWPALGFKAPDPYVGLTEEEKAAMATIDDDVCVIKYEDQTDRFIRGVIRFPVIGSCQTMEFGVWMSVSEASLDDYVNKSNNPGHENAYVGYLMNAIPNYKPTEPVIMRAVLQGPGLRPIMELKPGDYQVGSLEFDWFEGIPLEVAERRLGDILRDYN